MTPNKAPAATPMILAVAFIQSILVMGLLAAFIGPPSAGGFPQNLASSPLVFVGGVLAVAGVMVAYRAGAMRGWSQNGTRLEPFAVPDGAPDTADTYRRRATVQVIVGYALIEACAIFGLLSSLVMKQREWGMVLAGASFSCALAAAVPAFGIRAKAAQLESAGAAQPPR